MTHEAIYKERLIPHMVVDALNSNDDHPCLYLGGETATYLEVRRQVSRFAQALQAMHVGIGSRVALLSENCPEVVFFNLAAHVVGCTVTPLHPKGSYDDHAYVLHDAQIEALVFQPSNYEDRVAKLSKTITGVKHFLAFGPSETGEDCAALAKTFEPLPLVAPAIKPNGISNIVYTGGTTGTPKGVVHTCASITYMTMMQMAEWEIPSRVRFMVVTPLSHAGFTCLVPTLLRGGCLFVPPSFSPDIFFDMVAEHKITATMLVPAMIYTLLDAKRAEIADMSSMVSIFYGASPISAVRLKEAIERWGKIFAQFYGQVEAPTCFANLRKEDHDIDAPDRLACCGRPSSWIDLALLDDSGSKVDTGEVGEICVRGPLLMQRYLNKPDQTQEAFQGNWLHTGDLGRMNRDGFLSIVGRKKDMIITGGFNVYPREVEDVLTSHPEVQQAIVFGLPHEHWGEAVTAAVTLRLGISPSDDLSNRLIAGVKKAKGSIQAPKAIHVVDAIPLTPVGKPDKKALANLVGASPDASGKS